jgi:hypothetical protein
MRSSRPLRLEALEDRLMPTDLSGAGSPPPPTSGAFVGGTMDSSGATTITTTTTTDTSALGSFIVPTGTAVTL